jgi:hypothetical protein
MEIEEAKRAVDQILDEERTRPTFWANSLNDSPRCGRWQNCRHTSRDVKGQQVPNPHFKKGRQREASQIVRGNLVPNAYLAALAIESGSEWITTDRDFGRFPDLRWRHPHQRPGNLHALPLAARKHVALLWRTV